MARVGGGKTRLSQNRTTIRNQNDQQSQIKGAAAAEMESRPGFWT